MFGGLALLTLFLGLGIAPLLGGIGVFGWQVLHWLSEGEWVPRSVLHFMIWADYKRAWAENPTAWFGLWKLLNWLPLSVTGILYGATMSAIFASAARGKPEVHEAER